MWKFFFNISFIFSYRCNSICSMNVKMRFKWFRFDGFVAFYEKVYGYICIYKNNIKYRVFFLKIILVIWIDIYK